LRDLISSNRYDFLSAKNQEDLLEKQINTAIKIGYDTLDYIKKSSQIIEKTMLSLVGEIKNVSSAKSTSYEKRKTN
jgi:hypothetical protein